MLKDMMEGVIRTHRGEVQCNISIECTVYCTDRGYCLCDCADRGRVLFVLW